MTANEALEIWINKGLEDGWTPQEREELREAETILREAIAVSQILLDPENQPNQFGIVVNGNERATSRRDKIMGPVLDLRHEPEIFEYHRELPQILSEGNYVPNLHVAVGFASRCWKQQDGEQVFDTEQALRLVNELCAYVRLIKEGRAT